MNTPCQQDNTANAEQFERLQRLKLDELIRNCEFGFEYNNKLDELGGLIANCEIASDRNKQTIEDVAKKLHVLSLELANQATKCAFEDKIDGEISEKFDDLESKLNKISDKIGDLNDKIFRFGKERDFKDSQQRDNDIYLSGAAAGLGSVGLVCLVGMIVVQSWTTITCNMRN